MFGRLTCRTMSPGPRLRADEDHRGQPSGHRIAAPKGRDTRPTSDRVRENAFNLIGPVDGAAVLDLFAGSGALGLEALSRGAASCVFVESDREACRAINANLDKLRLEATVLCQDAVGRSPPRRRGPTTSCSAIRPTTTTDATSHRPHLPSVLAEDGLLVYETAAREQPELPASTSAPQPQVRLRTPYAVRAVITAICPGSYDPVTNGHIDVITRAAAIFDRVVVGVVGDPQHKTPLFTRSTSASRSSRRRVEPPRQRRGRRLLPSSSSTSPAAGTRR